MEFELKIYGAFCSIEKFIINGIRADSSDFGEQRDNDAENAGDYACGNMVFERKPATEEVLEKYKITKHEYEQIAEKLEDGLSFRCCGWCV